MEYLRRLGIGLDSLLRRQGAEEASAGRGWAGRGVVVFLLLFSLTVPHSIAASQTSFLLALLFHVAGNVGSPGLRLRRSPIDLPLTVFAGLTVLSSVFSLAPGVSLGKLKGLGLFLLFYLITTSLGRRGCLAILGCLTLSGLIGLGYSLTEKLMGRGMTITVIKPWSPLAGSGLVPGDVIWMIGRRRVRSLEEVREVMAGHQVGERLEVEALHAGDPIPVKLVVTEEARVSAGGLGIAVSGPTRNFRISGLTRQFITYAEQMQLLGLLLLGVVLTRVPARWRLTAVIGLGLFAGGLVLTATRSVIASFVGALAGTAVRLGSRRMAITALIAAVLIGAAGLAAVVVTRRGSLAGLSDDSASRRLGYMKAGLRVIPRHPLLGIGMDSHRRFWRELGFPGDYITHTHSTPIQVAMDRGLPALGCLVWLLIATWRMLQTGRRSAEERGDRLGSAACVGALACLAGFSLSALTNYNFGDSETLMLLLAIVGAARGTAL